MDDVHYTLAQQGEILIADDGLSLAVALQIGLHSRSTEDFSGVLFGGAGGIPCSTGGSGGWESFQIVAGELFLSASHRMNVVWNKK